MTKHGARARGVIAALAVVLVTALLAGCGGSGDGGGGAAAPAGPAGAPGTTTRPAGAPKPSPGCGTSTVKAVENDKRTIDVRGAEHFYLLTTPAKHDGTTPLPLVLDFHGLMEGAQIHAGMTQFGKVAQKEGFVVAFPNGSGQPVKWDVNPDPAVNTDLAFIDQLVERLGRDLCIDTSRVYATGLSYGAIMTSFLTCQRSEVFAAVAPVDGIRLPPQCDQKRKVPILAMHGTADPILPFNGGAGDLTGLLNANAQPGASTTATTIPPYDLDGPGYPQTVAQWAERNGCKPEPTDTKVSTEVIRRVYDCPAASPVEFIAVVGGGHAWPGSEFSKTIEKIVGHTTFDIDASAEAWTFFQRFQLPG